MLKISALNEESNESCGSEGEVTREALEQIALQQYAKALELQRTEKTTEALQLLKDLLDTEVLSSVRKPGPGEKVTTPLFNLKYLCYKNIATILSKENKTEEAIEAYIEASLLDDTDVSLWHRLGVLCLESTKYDIALQSFQKGFICNRRHWPCIDKIIILLFGLGYYNECIERILMAFDLDPYFLRGIVYQRYIYENYPYIREYMCNIDKKYEFIDQSKEEVDEDIAEKLLEEAKIIHRHNIQEIKREMIVFRNPVLKLRKPIVELSWLNLCESVVFMYKFMTDSSYSHASVLELICDLGETMDISINNSDVTPNKELQSNEELKQDGVESMEVDVKEDSNMDDEGSSETGGKLTNEAIAESVEPIKDKDQKKSANRRRGSELSILEPWEWYKRKSNRKKIINPDRALNIYDILRRLLPNSLLSPGKTKEINIDDSPDTMDIYRLFEAKENSRIADESNKQGYFGTKLEQSDVKDFIESHNAKNSDIIIVLKDILKFLSKKWHTKFPDGLSNLYAECDEFCSNHFDKPSICEDNFKELKNYVLIKLLSEECNLVEKLDVTSNSIGNVQFMDLFINEPTIFGEDHLFVYLRFLWWKCNLYLKQNCDDLALDCLYQLRIQFKAMKEEAETFKIELPNFSKESVIKLSEVSEMIQQLERNKKLSKVLTLYRNDDLEGALDIITGSYDECKTLAQKGFYDEISLDWAVQLSLIIDCLWGLGKTSECFKWATKCLNESLRHYLQWKTDTKDGERWSLIVTKCLVSIEYILKIDGTSVLDNLDEKQLADLVEDVIKIIGQQVEENVGSEVTIDTVVPWIILHYILQREEDHGRDKKFEIIEKGTDDEIPNALTILFIGHDYLGKKSWCCNSEGSLLYFILDTVIPRLRSPALARPMELICHYLEQCVFCLFAHPGKKNKLKYLEDHNVNPHKMDWLRAQQLYEIFRPTDLPEIEGKIPSINSDIEQLFQRMLSLMPQECQPQKYVPEMVKYIDGRNSNLPIIPIFMPYKLKDIFYILGDYYFKKDERGKAIKYNLYDVIVNNDRFESWAEMALAKGANYEIKVNSCDEMKSDVEFLNEAEGVVRCFKRALDLDPVHYNLWIEYGVFTYSLHSYCSRSLKQASESLSMEDFQTLELKKEDMLDTAYKCFSRITDLFNESDASDSASDELWLQFYFLGKIAEKRTKSPHVYLEFYMKAAKNLSENKASYPAKINYNSPQKLALEALEINYRIHASILKYVEQHEHKVIHESEAKLFLKILEECSVGPFGKKKAKTVQSDEQKEPEVNQVAGSVKRSASDAGEETPESKRTKLETGVMTRRASVGDISMSKENSENINEAISDVAEDKCESKESTMLSVENGNDIDQHNETVTPSAENAKKDGVAVETVKKDTVSKGDDRRTSADTNTTATTTSSDSSSSESSDSSSESSSSDLSSSEDEANQTVIPAQKVSTKPAKDEDIQKIIDCCLDALEDCVSRFPQHYKALFRSAHYHFYYKKGKDIERCRDLMLTTFQSRNGQKLQGLFSERKNNNFFNNIWRIPEAEIDRPGSFAFHMARCVLLSMEILKEIDDHKTLLDLSIQLQKVPEPDRKYLRDSERKELAQQAFSLCVQSLKGQLTKFGQQDDLKSNNIEIKAFNSLMLDIYRAYQRAQKQPNSKQFTNLLIEGYKMCTTNTIAESTNLVDASMKYCQGLIAARKQQATMASKTVTKDANTNKAPVKNVETIKTAPPVKSKSLPTDKTVPPSMKNMSPQEIAAALQKYLPSMAVNDPMLAQQTTAALSLQQSLSYFSQLGPLSSNYAALQAAMQNSFQSEFCRQYLSSGLMTKPSKPTKSKSAVASTSNYQKTAMTSQTSDLSKQAHKSLTTNSGLTIKPSGVSSKHPTQGINQSQKASIPTSNQKTHTSMFPVKMTAPRTSSFDSNVKPAHMYSSSSVYTSVASVVKPAHQNTSSTVSAAIQAKPPMPHEQVSPGKTLQEKLAEKQKKISSNENGGEKNKFGEARRSLSFGSATTVPQPKPVSSDEVIVLDDD